SMAGILWAMSLSLLVQAFLGTAGQTDRGCLKWSLHANGRDVCCDICHPGNHLQEDCGPNPRELCIPCEAKTFTVNPKAQSCSPCTECVGAQVLVKECTATHDTVCECKEGLVCGDATCSFCVKKCGKGEEPTETRSCTPCPNGTFNDQIHQKCKPWSKTCPPYKVVGEGTALTDITCVDTGTEKVKLHPEITPCYLCLRSDGYGTAPGHSCAPQHCSSGLQHHHHCCDMENPQKKKNKDHHKNTNNQDAYR
uniref:TNFR-Cys domain-containing protein n=1 Tax=Mola mola TaxID=94237 RepID=A0A3Q3WSP4_MOLML